MITDLNPLESGTAIDADLCIVGGGAAAIAIARELVGSERVICVLESGGLGLEARAQALAGGTTSGIPYFPLDESRYRMLGGSTFRWGARGAPMVEIDFEPRPWLNQDGWPIRREELEPYYDRVAALADWRAPFDYDARVWDLFDAQPPPFDDKLFRFSAFQFGKIVLFGEQYRKLLEGSQPPGLPARTRRQPPGESVGRPS